MITPYKVYLNQVEVVKCPPEGDAEIFCPDVPSIKLWIEALARKFNFIVQYQQCLTSNSISAKITRK